MKRNLLKIIVGTVLAFIVSAVAAFGPTLAYGETDSLTNSAGVQSGGRLVGTWEVTVTIRNCQNNIAIRSFSSVTTFMQGGTLIDSTSGVPQSRKTPGQGVWGQAGGNTYNFSFKHFNFDDAGNYAGWNILRQTASFDPVKDEYYSQGTLEVFDPNGNLIMKGCSSTTATRFQ